MNYSLTIFLLFVGFLSMAQKEEYPKGYFLFPIKPNQQNFLAGTMGEIRSNHFHAGIDIKTDQRIGLPVYAAADGFVSRVNISPYGYGNTIYLEHPNGYTTVYAHLEHFNKQIDSIALVLQYQQKSFSIDQYFTRGMFPVKRGDIIAYSGNTGGSQGPHLHFEIRDKNQDVLNPLLFGFDEIKDDLAPVIKQISLKSFDTHSHVKNQFDSFYFTASKVNSFTYKINEVIPAYGRIGLAIKTDDLLNGATNQNGVNLIIVKVDSQEVFRFHNTIFSFAKKLHMNQHIDYQAYKSGKGAFHKCYLDEGNQLDGYSIGIDKGFLNILDTLLHDVQITVFDGYNNESRLSFKVQGQPLNNTQKAFAGKFENIQHEVIENILKITVQHKNTIYNPTLYSKESPEGLIPAYQFAGKSVYLWDLRKGLPDSLTTPHSTYRFHFLHMIPSPNSYDYYNKDFNISFDKYTLFDTLYLEADCQNDVFDFQHSKTPVARYFTITLKPKGAIANADKTHVYEKRGAGLSFVGGHWLNNHISFSTKTFGKYVLSTDVIPPTITFVNKINNEVSFRIKDDKSGIKSYAAYLNGEWLLMKYDYKNQLITSERLNKKIPMVGNLTIEVTDEANNKKIFTLKL